MAEARRDRFRLLAGFLLAASVAATGWLLAHPGAPAESPAAVEPGALPPLDPVLTLVASGRQADAVTALASMVRAAPALADKGGPLTLSQPLRDLVLTGWKGVVAAAGDRSTAVTRDIRFLQRRLAGGCS